MAGDVIVTGTSIVPIYSASGGSQPTGVLIVKSVILRP